MTDSLDLTLLETLAKQATQGEWFHRTAPGLQGFVQVNVEGSEMPYGLELLCDDYNGFGNDEQREKDCAFVAALNPKVVLQLLAELKDTKDRLSNLMVLCSNSGCTVTEDDEGNTRFVNHRATRAD